MTLDIHPSVKMKGTLTYDVGLGNGGRCLCSSKLTL
jgi:hypothetical protein